MVEVVEVDTGPAVELGEDGLTLPTMWQHTYTIMSSSVHRRGLV